MDTVSNEAGLTMDIAFNLFDLKQRLQMKIKREITLAEIADTASLHRNTVERILSNQTNRVDLSTVAKLLLFFHSMGMPIGIEDLIVTGYHDSVVGEAEG